MSTIFDAFRTRLDKMSDDIGYRDSLLPYVCAFSDTMVEAQSGGRLFVHHILIL